MSRTLECQTYDYTTEPDLIRPLAQEDVTSLQSMPIKFVVLEEPDHYEPAEV